jgi:hypothetical protein
LTVEDRSITVGRAVFGVTGSKATIWEDAGETPQALPNGARKKWEIEE